MVGVSVLTSMITCNSMSHYSSSGISNSVPNPGNFSKPELELKFPARLSGLELGSAAVTPTTCEATEFRALVQSLVEGWTAAEFNFYNNFYFVVLDTAYLFDNTDGGQFYGSIGQFTIGIQRAFRDLQRFFGIPTDILLRDAHANAFEDVAKLAKYLVVGYGWPQAQANDFANQISAQYVSLPKLKNHPLLTFNAFAAPADSYWGTPKKIVLGDGIMEAYEKLGYGDVAAQGILAHEYAHQVQFAKNVQFVYVNRAINTMNELIVQVM